jgi:GT2 family glycosyltransferase
MDGQTMSYKVVIPSRCATNLVRCVQSVLANEPVLRPSDILVVDDGARAAAEPLLPGVSWLQGAKPFIFARNVNIGIAAAAEADVILLNDDARLVTLEGFSLLSLEVESRPDMGVCSAGILGVVGNPRQLATPQASFRIEPSGLAFVCVYLPRSVCSAVGPFDVRFSGYGFEDNDYCARVRAAGLNLGIWDGCVVDHSGELPSTFRTRPDITAMFEQNRRLFRAKWRMEA